MSLKNYLLVALGLVHSGLAQTCPAELTVTNGGFECGLSPWYVPAPQPGQPKMAIASPGYDSYHALRLDVAESNFTDFSLVHPPIGLQCEGYYYKLSYAVNWDTYSGPASTETIGCKVRAQSSYCFGDIVGTDQVYAVPGAGWKTYSYTCLAKKTGQGTYTVDFDCFGNATYRVPAFNFEVDALNIKLLGKSP
ncbi:hypothetical protein VFPPC_10954 [Pochonia chlamydosporia 170]|uniref:Uncharacterized protein n=1 Tax=Pochonia chlamydosporia 170 TaxID=1380566 RepID=A0A179EZX8_METCM|nr:hypothetical protein VFPPC_10954 [Pochonia chlamydosporia 170]OAQ58731.1 hypothetical protein VFPPC_10954 [Pochonia chlamydosporia 170]